MSSPSSTFVNTTTRSTSPMTRSVTPDPELLEFYTPFDFIARYGYTGGMNHPESLEGYSWHEVHEEFLETQPLGRNSWGFREIIQGSFPMGVDVEDDEALNAQQEPFTRIDSPIPWLDQVAGNAPSGWGPDGSLVGNLVHPQ